MNILIKKNEKTDTNEAYDEKRLIGVFEQMTPGDNKYSFMTKCPHDYLTGDHYIAIGHKLNELNG